MKNYKYNFGFNRNFYISIFKNCKKIFVYKVIIYYQNVVKYFGTRVKLCFFFKGFLTLKQPTKLR